jgi:hypothetical protein
VHYNDHVPYKAALLSKKEISADKKTYNVWIIKSKWGFEMLQEKYFRKLTNKK